MEYLTKISILQDDNGYKEFKLQPNLKDISVDEILKNIYNNYNFKDTEDALIYLLQKKENPSYIDISKIDLSIDKITDSFIVYDVPENSTVTANIVDESLASINIETSFSGELIIKLSALEEGSSNIRVIVSENSNFKEKIIEIPLTVSNMPDPILNNNTPEMIQKTARAGLAPNYWNVGDKVAFDAYGTIGSTLVDLELFGVFILGFNHNSEIEGSNTIHFQFGNYGYQYDIALIDSKCYNTVNENDTLKMNTSDSNTGGWKNSYMRNTICKQFFEVTSDKWKNVISECNKYTDNTGGTSNNSSNVTSTLDKIWLLSEFEVFGTRTYANSAEQNFQKRYDYYKNGNSPRKNMHNIVTTAASWWLRTPSVAITTKYCCVGSSSSTLGKISQAAANYSYGLAPGFVVS